MARPVIAFLTDFGTTDHYAGTLKGVVLGICPDATCVDITHGIPPHDVMAGALELAAACRYFPPATIFVAVVDPGVGSTRRPIAAEAGPYRFVSPDNGILTLVFREMPPSQVVELTDPRYARPTVSRTFEGRDRFAPAAAWLARGVALSALGPRLASWQSLDVPEPAIDGARLVAQVVRVDRFGNLITNVNRPTLERFATDGRVEIAVGVETVPALATCYADVDPGALCALFGSSDHLEIAVNGGSAAERLNMGRGAQVVIRAGR